MKKAIVIAITMMLGLGLTAFAGPLSGSWASSLVVDPAASSIISLSSTLAVDYTVSVWTFGSSSSFTLSDFTSQSFTAGGSVNAFTFGSTVTFDQMMAALVVRDDESRNYTYSQLAAVTLSDYYEFKESAVAYETTAELKGYPIGQNWVRTCDGGVYLMFPN